MQLYVLQDGKQTGPFEEAEIISQWKKGILKDTDLVYPANAAAWVEDKFGEYVWTKGLDEWTPLGKLIVVALSAQPEAVETVRSPKQQLITSNTDRNRAIYPDEPAKSETPGATTPYSIKISSALAEISKTVASIDECKSKGFVGYCTRCGKQVELYSDLVQTPGPGVLIGTGNFGGSGIGMGVYRPTARSETGHFCRDCGHRIYVTNIDRLIKHEEQLKVHQQRHAVLCQREHLWRRFCRLSVEHPYLANSLRLSFGLSKLRALMPSEIEMLSKVQRPKLWQNPQFIPAAVAMGLAVTLFLFSSSFVFSFALLCLIIAVPVLLWLDSTNPILFAIAFIVAILGIYYLILRFFPSPSL